MPRAASATVYGCVSMVVRSHLLNVAAVSRAASAV